MIRVCLAAALLAGCASSGAPTGAADTEAAGGPAVALGDTARVAAGATADVAGVSVRFDAVAEDSRCPADVDCFWEGRARVRLTVAGTPAVLTAPHGGVETDDEPQSVVRDGVRVRLVALDPAPGSAAAGEPVTVVLVGSPPEDK